MLSKLPHLRHDQGIRVWILIALSTATPAFPQLLDPTWTITVNGQSVQVNPDGSFRLRNIAAADLFGPGGPGTAPDFLSDDFLRVTGVGTVDGVTQYAFSDPFQIRQGQTFVVGDLTVTDIPLHLVQSIRVAAAAGLLEVGQTSQLTVTGTLPDGAQVDVTPRTSWTTYRTSNPAVATVGPDGLVTANGLGTATITASNEGTTATTTIRVTSDVITTTVEGFVQDANRSGVSGVSMTASRFAGDALTGPDGFFSLTLSQIPVETTSLTVQGYATLGGQPYFGAATSLPIVADGITDAGIIQICPQVETRWAEGFGPPGTNGPVNAMAVWDDGAGPALYVAGNMGTAGGISARGIARWNGATWSALGSGLTNGSVYALAVFDDGTGPALYAGGSFTTAGGMSANRIARWNGTSWSALSSGMNGPVYALTVFDDGSGPALYAGGAFTTAGGISANYVAKWNGSSWSPLGSGTNNAVRALAVLNDGTGSRLYAGGDFTAAGGISAGLIARWNGTSWSALGSGMNNTVRAMTVFDDGTGPALYAGGGFTVAGGISARGIAKWGGASWSALGTGVNGWVDTLAVFDSGNGPALYVGGNFTTAGGMSANRIARWSGGSWSSLGPGLGISGNDVFAIATFDDGNGLSLYVGGSFQYLGDGLTWLGQIAKWNGTGWTGLGDGVNYYVHDFAVFDDGRGPSLYMAGDFTSAGGVRVNSIAKWNGESWLPLLDGFNYRVNALAVFDDDGFGPNPPALYAGGDFIMAGNLPVNHIAKWNGTAWSALGTGLDARAEELLVFDDGTGPALYAGGNFTIAGGITANYIAKWNGNSWSSLGTGMDSPVLALAGFDEDGAGPTAPKLFAGGVFLNAGGSPASRIAKWNGSTWSPLGSGVSNLPFSATVYDLTVFDDGNGPALFVGGSFTNAGGLSVSNIAKWNGNQWSAVGSNVGTNQFVESLGIFDDGTGARLYAGGQFSTVGGIAANRIARWDGITWSPLGTGLNGSVYGMQSLDDGTGRALWIGGSFNTAGGLPSIWIAKWYRPNTCRP